MGLLVSKVFQISTANPPPPSPCKANLGGSLGNALALEWMITDLILTEVGGFFGAKEERQVLLSLSNGK